MIHLRSASLLPGAKWPTEFPFTLPLVRKFEPIEFRSPVTFLALLKDMVAKDAQFIIATHSPILMAFPEATILSFDEHPVKAVPYADLEHVRITREFLANPDAYVRRL